MKEPMTGWLRLSLPAALLFTALAAAPQIARPAPVAAQTAQAVGACGTVTSFTAPTTASNGSITIAGQTFVIAAGSTVSGAVTPTVGSDICIQGQVSGGAPQTITSV